MLAVAVACPWDGYWNHGFKGRLFAPYGYWAGRKSIANSQFCLYVTRDFLQNRYPTKAPSIGCSDVNIDSFNAGLPKQFNCTSNHISIGTVGSVGVRYKGQEYVIRAIPELQKKGLFVDYYMIGGGDSTRLRRIVSKMGVEKNVHFVGMLSHEQIPLKMQEWDMYIQPSLQEGLPRAVVEAMSVGLPVIGCKTGGIPELIEEDWLIKRKSSKDIVAMIIKKWDKTVLQETSKRNVCEAQKYNSAILDEKRNNYLLSVVNLIKATKNE